MNLKTNIAIFNVICLLISLGSQAALHLMNNMYFDQKTFDQKTESGMNKSKLYINGDKQEQLNEFG